MKKIITSLFIGLFAITSLAKEVVLYKELENIKNEVSESIENIDNTSVKTGKLAIGEKAIADDNSISANLLGEHESTMAVYSTNIVINNTQFGLYTSANSYEMQSFLNLIDYGALILATNSTSTEFIYNVENFTVDGTKFYFNTSDNSKFSPTDPSSDPRYRQCKVKYILPSIARNHSLSIGNGTFATNSSYAEGKLTKSTGDNAHAEGYNTTASGSYTHAEGNITTASGAYAHAEGFATSASGAGSHSEGNVTTASGNYAHAEGQSAKATQTAAHAEGYNTTASAKYSHAEGSNTTASAACAHAAGVRATASHERSFVWNGQNNDYSSKGAGYFHINPVGGVSGIYIGNSKIIPVLSSHFAPIDIKYGCQGINTFYIENGEYDENIVNIDNADGAVQWFSPVGSGDVEITLVLPDAEDYEDCYGLFTIFIKTIDDDDYEHFCFSDDYCYSSWFPSTQPWNNNTENATWKIKWEMIPNTYKWYFMGAEKYPE